MAQFYALAMGNAGDYKREILSCTVLEHLSLAVEAAGGQLYLASDNTEAGEITTADFWKKAGNGPVLLFLAPAAGIGADTVKRLVSQTEPACLVAGRMPLAVFGQADALQKSDLSQLPGDLAQVQAGPGEGMAVNTAESAYVVQEQLRRRINMEWMQKGVMLVDPNTTHISPKAKLESGCTVLPGCLIYGDSTVAKGAVIGPNTWLKSAHIGENVTEKSSMRVTGWIVQIDGANPGKEYRIHSGYNYIGRAEGDIRVEGDDYISSVKDSQIYYDATNVAFYTSHVNGANAVCVNGEPVVSGAAKLKAYDILMIGKTRFVFVPLCSEQFNWEDAK